MEIPKEVEQFRQSVSKLSDDEKEFLLHLHASPSWKAYKKILNDQIIRRLWGTMSIKDPMEIKEAAGIGAGLNLSINLLDRLVETINKDRGVSGQA